MACFAADARNNCEINIASRVADSPLRLAKILTSFACFPSRSYRGIQINRRRDSPHVRQNPGNVERGWTRYVMQCHALRRRRRGTTGRRNSETALRREEEEGRKSSLSSTTFSRLLLLCRVTSSSVRVAAAAAAAVVLLPALLEEEPRGADGQREEGGS